jgi:nucleotide-binding universal stress UspA family protein
MIGFVPGAGRLIVGTSGSPGSLAALRYARDVARKNDVPLMAVLAWTPPEGDLAERRWPCAYMRQLWVEAARQRLRNALGAAWGAIPADLDLQAVVIRGEPGPALVDTADSPSDLLIVGAGRGGKLSRFWRGRVSRYCLAHARCPVLAVPQPITAKQMGLGPTGWALRHRGLTLDRALRDWDTAA